MKTRSAAFACALLGAVMAVSAAAPRSLYAAPPAPAEASVEDPSAPTPDMEEKFRKLQKEMRGAPAASPGSSRPSGSGKDTVSVGGLALQILFGLAVVLLLAVLSIRGLKRLQGRMLSRTGPGGDMLEVLETCHLGPQQKVVVLRMHDEVGVIGVTKEGMSLLATLKQPAEELRRARGQGNSAAFSDNLNKLLERFKKPKKVSDMLEEA